MQTVITATIEKAATEGMWIGWMHVERGDKGHANSTNIDANRYEVMAELLEMLHRCVQAVRLFEEPIVNNHIEELPK